MITWPGMTHSDWAQTGHNCPKCVWAERNTPAKISKNVLTHNICWTGKSRDDSRGTTSNPGQPLVKFFRYGHGPSKMFFWLKLKNGRDMAITVLTPSHNVAQFLTGRPNCDWVQTWHRGLKSV